jgi:hypothetical protein
VLLIIYRFEYHQVGCSKSLDQAPELGVMEKLKEVQKYYFSS